MDNIPKTGKANIQSRQWARQIRNRLIEIVQSVKKTEKCQLGSRLREDIGCQEEDVVDILLQVEEMYEVEYDNMMAGEFRSVRDIWRYVIDPDNYKRKAQSSHIHVYSIPITPCADITSLLYQPDARSSMGLSRFSLN